MPKKAKLIKVVSFGCDPKLHYKIEEAAERESQTIAAFARRIVREYLNGQEEKLKTD